MKKWIFLIAFFVFGGVIFSIWSEQNKGNYIGGILNNISLVDLIIVKDSETENKYTNILRTMIFLTIWLIYMTSPFLN